MTDSATEERAEKIVDEYFSIAPHYRVRETLVAMIAAELAGHEALVSALRAIQKTFVPSNGNLGTGRYSFPANGKTAELLEAALKAAGLEGDAQ